MAGAPLPKIFDLVQRPGADECAVGADNVTNLSSYEYQVANFYNNSRDTLIDFSTPQTNLRFYEGYGTPSAEVMEDASAIRDDFLWRARGKSSLPARIYHAVPDLSHGPPNPDDETKVWHAKIEETSSEILAEQSFDRFEPLLSHIQQTVQNPDTVVPSAWVNGGQDTRGMLRDPNYLAEFGYRQDPNTGAWTRAQ
jgi:hypothetical protein